MKRRRIKDYLGITVLIQGREAFLAQADRRKGITFKWLDDETDAYCLNRDYFEPGPKGTAAFLDLFETNLIWAETGEIKWDAHCKWDGTINVFPVGEEWYSPGYCAFK
jgi:hypothetical protein